MYLGIHPYNMRVFEGSSSAGWELHPMPILSPASFPDSKVAQDREPPRDLIQLNSAKYLFREDSFDPVSRIKRGRLYICNEERPWGITATHLIEARDPNASAPNLTQNYITLNLMTFIRHPLPEGVKRGSILRLGIRDAQTLWRIVDVESIHTSESMLTLRARSAWGLLPELETSTLPPKYAASVAEYVQRATDDSVRAGPLAIIELCRHAASAVLIAFLGQEIPTAPAEDLRRAADAFRDHVSQRKAKSLFNVANYANVLAGLHVQNKPTTAAIYGARALTDQDAETALNCLSGMLLDLGWARPSA